MPTSSKKSAGAVETEDRDIELENIIGNLLIAEYQVDRLRNRLIEKISPAFSNTQVKDRSAYSFKFRNKWYRVSLKVEEQKLTIEGERNGMLDKAVDID